MFVGREPLTQKKIVVSRTARVATMLPLVSCVGVALGVGQWWFGLLYAGAFSITLAVLCRMPQPRRLTSAGEPMWVYEAMIPHLMQVRIIAVLLALLASSTAVLSNR